MTQIKDSRTQWNHTIDNLSVSYTDPKAAGLIYLDPSLDSVKQWENPFVEDNHCVLASFKDAWKLFDIPIGKEEMLATENYTRINSIAITIGGGCGEKLA